MSWQAQLDAFLAMSERDKCRLCEEEFHLEMDAWRSGERTEKPARTLLTEWITHRETTLRYMADLNRSLTGRVSHTQPNMQSLPGTGSKFVEDAMEGYCRKDIEFAMEGYCRKAIEFAMSLGLSEQHMIEWMLKQSNVKVTYGYDESQPRIPTQAATKQYVDDQLAMYRDKLVSMRTVFKNLGVSPDAIDENGNYIEIKTYKGKS